jgi:hypothetical protein
MILERFGEEKISSRGMYIRSSYIPPNWDDMRSIADITKLWCAIPWARRIGIIFGALLK